MLSLSQDFLVELLAPILVYTLGKTILHVCKNKRSIAETIALSYLIGIATIVLATFIGSIFGLFIEVSRFLWGIGLVSIVFEVWLLMKNRFYLQIAKTTSEIIYILLVCGSLLIVYAIVLSLRVISDSDVAHLYLPMARQLVSSNVLNFSTGYDYNIFLKSIGSSLLYGWTYSLSTSLSSEPFRLLPLTSLLASMILTYLIAKQVTDNVKTASISLLIFSILSIHDRFLEANAFYPDMFYLPFGLYIFYILLRYWHISKASDAEKRNLKIDMVYLGTAYGVASLFKAQTVFLLVPLFVWIGAKISNKILSWLIVSISLCIPIIADIAATTSFGTRTIGISFIGLGYFIGILAIWLLLCLVFLLVGLDDKNMRDMFCIKDLTWFFIPFLLVTGLFFGYQALLYGGILFTSSVKIRNLDWAIEQLASTSSVPISLQTPFDGMIYYILLMALVPVGFQYFVIILIGGILAKKVAPYRALLLISLSYFLALIARSFYVIEKTGIFSLNPRDSYLLTPILCMPLALFIRKCSSASKNLNATDLFLISYLGLISYLTSPFLYTYGSFSFTIRPLVDALLAISNMNLKWSLLILPRDRFTFLSLNFIHFLFQSFLCAILPLLFLMIKQIKYPRLILIIKGARHQIKIARALFIFILTLTLVFPRVEILLNTAPRGGFTKIGLDIYLGSLVDFIHDYKKYNVKGIITFGMPDYLPYYAEGIYILDLSNAANLARLRDVVEESNISKIIHTLKLNGISHFLLPSSDSSMPDVVRSFLIKVIREDNGISFITSYGSWVLLSLNESKVR